MAGDVRDAAAPEPVLDGSGLRIAIVIARFNSHVTLRLLGGARRRLSELGVADTDISARARVQTATRHVDQAEVVHRFERLGIVVPQRPAPRLQVLREQIFGAVVLAPRLVQFAQVVRGGEGVAVVGAQQLAALRQCGG